MILNYPTTKEAISESRRLSERVAVADGRILCRVLGRWLMYLDARDVGSMPYLAMNGIYEPQFTEALCRVLSPGMGAVDAGACFGYSTLCMAELVGDKGKVFAFEPNPRCFHILKLNMELNRFRDTVRTYPFALGEAVGKGKLVLHKRRFGAATMAEKAIAASGSEDTEERQIFTLDYMCAQANFMPDVVCLSVSGYEPQVWAGMRSVVNPQSKRKLAILLDFTPRWYAEPDKFAAEILDYGFAVNRVHETGDMEPIQEVSQFMGPYKSLLLLTR